MDLERSINQIKSHPEYSKVGMILCHNGVVRGTSRDGTKVKGLKVEVDSKVLSEIIEQNKKKDGIVEIIVEINDNRNLSVGDDVMLIVVAGDFRENVISVLTDTLNRVKRTVTKKTEFFV